MERLLIWASGYDAGLVDAYSASPADRSALKKIGGSLLFSAAWLATMTALAAWTMAFQAPIGLRVAIAALAFAAAARFVLTFDRAFVFGMDTCRASARKALSYGIARVLLVVAIGGLVDVAVMPVMMREELQLEATRMREAAEGNRLAALSHRYDVSGRRADLAEARTDLDQARAAAANLPPQIIAELAGARRCFAALPPRGSAGYADRRQRCAGQQRSAQGARAEYQRVADQRLAEAQSSFADARSGYEGARAALSGRMDVAADDYGRIFSAANFAVFIQLVSTQFSAALKAILLLLVHLSLDLLPFGVKGYLGRTGVGARIRAHKEAELLEAEAELDASQAEYCVRVETSRAAAAATSAALARPSMALFMEDMADYMVRASEPLEQAKAAMRRAAAAEADIDRVKVRTPALRQFKTVLWTRAVAESLRAVGGPAPGTI